MKRTELNNCHSESFDIQWIILARLIVVLISLIATGNGLMAIFFMADNAPLESRTMAMSEFFSEFGMFIGPVVGILWLGSVVLWFFKRPAGWFSVWDVVVASVPLALWACVLLPHLFPGIP